MSNNQRSRENPINKDSIISGFSPRAEWVLSLLFVLIVATSIIDYTRASDVAHILTAVPAVFLFGILALHRNPIVEVPRYALLAYLVIWGTYIPHAVTPPISTFALARIPVFMASSFVLLFIVPNVISLEQFLSTTFYLAAAVTMIGLPTAFIGEYQLFGLVISGFRNPENLLLFGMTLHPVKSVFANPNPFGGFVGIGIISGLGVYYHRRRPVDGILLGIVTSGLILSMSRAALLSVVAASLLFFTYRLRGRLAVYQLSLVGLITTVYLIGALVGYLPDFVGMRHVEFYARFEFWSDAIKALDGHELFGVGFQPRSNVVGTNNLHSGYVFVLLTRGIVGGLAHVAFLCLAYRQRLISLTDAKSAALLGLLTIVLILMAFESVSLFGFAVYPVVASLVIGFSIRSDKTLRQSPI